MNKLLEKFCKFHFNNNSYARANPYILAGSIAYLTPHQLTNVKDFSTSRIINVLNQNNLTKDNILNFIYTNFQNLDIFINYRISKDFMLQLVNSIFNYIQKNNIIYSNLDHEFEKFNEYIYNSDLIDTKINTFKKFSIKIVHDLIYLIVYFKKLNDQDINQFIYLRDIAKDIISNKIADFLVLNNFNIDHLVNRYLNPIVHFLKDSYSDYFTLRTRGNQNSLNEFDLNYIRLYKKKVKVFTDTFQFDSYTGMFTKTFYGKCEFLNCDIGFLMLPTLEFDHLVLNRDDPRYLEFSREILNHNYNKIKSLVESQFGGFRILCRNHHNLISADIYNSYYNYIYIYVDHLYYNKGKVLLPIRDFELNLNKYKKVLKESFNGNIQQRNIRNGILTHIKKNYIIGYLFGKKYLVYIANNLPAFCFHHIDPQIKRNSIAKLIQESDDINFIINTIIQEECVCISHNDHSMIHSSFFKLHYDKIIGKSSKPKIETYYRSIDSYLYSQHQKILKLKADLNDNFKFRLKYEY